MKENLIQKRIILSMALIIILLLAINIKIEIDKNKMKKEIEVLNLKKEDMRDVTPEKEIAYLRGLGHIKLHFSPDGHPAYGYKADVNTFIRSNDNKVEIIESNSNWARVNINGWIPKWYLVNDKPKKEEVEWVYPTQKRTVKEDCRLYLTPEENDNLINPEFLNIDNYRLRLGSGQVLEVFYEYEEWYYVKRYILWDANNYREGWVKKSHLATYEEVKPSEVMIKKGTIVYDWDGIAGQTKLVDNTYGRIKTKKDGWCEVILPGVSFFRINEDDVIYED